MLSRDPKATPNVVTDETTISDVTIGPDGRIYVFVASVSVLEALAAAGFGGDMLRQRLEHLRAASQDEGEKSTIV
jgi:hypothetical protein